MTDQLEHVLESKPVQFSGKGLFVLGIVGGALNLITRMEFIQTSVVIVSGILGAIFMVYKIQMIRLDIDRKKKQIAEEELLQKKLRERLDKNTEQGSE